MVLMRVVSDREEPRAPACRSDEDHRPGAQGHGVEWYVLESRQKMKLRHGVYKERSPDSPLEIKTRPGWKVYKGVQLDTLKLYTHAHGSKTTNLIINLDHQEWILADPAALLQTLDIQNETELSFFNRADYDSFLEDPTEKWQ